MALVTVIERARQAGFRVALENNEVVIRGPKARADVVEELRQHREEVLAILEGRACLRCGGEDGPLGSLVPTYWTLWRQALCPPCIGVLVQEFEERDSWPRMPPELIEDRP